MNSALWIVSGLLALVFLASGAVKLTQTNAKLASYGMSWAESFTTGSVKTIGILEILAAAGLILPAVFRIAPVLVPLAATGTAAMMAAAMIMHVRRREPQGIVVSGILLVLALFAVVGRFAIQPIAG